MPKISDTALVILSNAANRKTGLILPLPKSLKGGDKASKPILKNLLKQRLIAEQPGGAAPAWREEGDARWTLAITEAGVTATSSKVDGSAKKGGKARAKKSSKRWRKAASGAKEAKATKLDLLKGMLGSKDGMTVAEASKATGWLMHSVRGVMSGVFKKKLGLEFNSEKIEGRGRVYRLAR